MPMSGWRVVASKDLLPSQSTNCLDRATDSRFNFRELSDYLQNICLIEGETWVRWPPLRFVAVSVNLYPASNTFDEEALIGPVL